jgi:hypothetical protein
MPRRKAGTQTHEGDAVAVVGVHVGLHFENKAGDFAFGRFHHALVGFLRARRGRVFGEAKQQFAHAEIIDRAAEVNRRHMACAVAFGVKGRAKAAHHLDLLAQFLRDVRAEQLIQLRIVEAVAGDAFGQQIALGLVHQDEAVTYEVIASLEIAPHADGPACGRNVERERLLDLAHQVERIAGFPIHFINERHNRHVAQAAYFEQFSCLRFDALGRVDNHDGAIDGGEGAVGVLGKILVAGGIDEVEAAFGEIEAHHRGADRDAAFALHLHPVGSGAALLAARLDRARQLDRAAEQQQFFRQRRFTRVRMRDNRKRPAAGDGGFQVVGSHIISLLLPPPRATSPSPWRRIRGIRIADRCRRRCPRQLAHTIARP